MVTNNVTVYQFEVGLDEVFADEVRFNVNVDCVIVVVVKDCLFFMFIFFYIFYIFLCFSFSVRTVNL